MVKKAKDHVAHRRLSLKMALRHSSLSLKQLLREPVYKTLAAESSPGEAIAAIRQDIEHLRANGEAIAIKQGANGGDYLYHLDDTSSIHLDTTGLNMGLLMPLLAGKDHRPTRRFAHMGVNKALASGKAQQTSVAMALSIPVGDAAPTLAYAVQHRRIVDIDYMSVTDREPVRRCVEPWALEIHAGVFYLRALRLLPAENDSLSGAKNSDKSVSRISENPARRAWSNADIASMRPGGERLYKLSRMSRCEITEHTIRYPVPQVQDHSRDFFAPVTAIVAIDPGQAPALAARGEHLGGDLYMFSQTDRACLFEDLAFYGESVTVLAPSSLVQDIQERTAYLARQLKHSATPRHLSCLPSSAELSHTSAHPDSEHKNQGIDSRSHRHHTQIDSARAKRDLPMQDLAISRRESYYAYLLKNGPQSLKDIAKHFAVSPLIAYRELKDLYTTEISVHGYYVAPYDLDIPLWENEADIDPEQVITALQQPGVEELAGRDISFTLAEIISLLSAVDSLLSVASGEHERELLAIRSRVTQAAAQAGYRSALWPAPHTRCASAVVQALVHAIDHYEIISIAYSQLGSDGTVRTVHSSIKPFAIDPQLNPLLAAMNEDDELRTYRIDRISAVSPTGSFYPKTPVRQWKKDYRKHEMDFQGEEVEIRLTKEGRWACEELPGAQLIAAEDARSGEPGKVDTISNSESLVASAGDIIIRARIANVHWLRTLLMRLGRSFSSLSPAALADDLAPHMQALAEHYQSARQSRAVDYDRLAAQYDTEVL